MVITLNDFAQKLQKILNGTDTEVTGSVPVGFQFEVKTAGFHLDKISDTSTNKNFIPVFVNSLGGEYNPVPQVKEQRQTISVTFYFPVRFKEDFYVLGEYLANAFVGGYLTYGTSKKAVSNLSIPQFGEIQDIDLKQFSEWVSNEYQREVDINEPFMSMSFSVYLLQSDTNFVYGNAATVSLKVSKGTTTYTDDKVAIPDISIQSTSEPAAQQLLGATIPETDGLPVHTSYASGFSVYYKSNEMYKWLLEQWFGGYSQSLVCEVTITFDTKTFTRTCYLQSANLVMSKGSLVTFTFSFIKRVSGV